MQVLDTNVVVRYITNDDAVQSPVARRSVDAHRVRLTWTVVLETEWVLRSAHKLTRERIAHVLDQFVRLPTVSIDESPRFAQALEWFRQGMDFADAMHLVSCNDGDEFATFDRKFAAAARKARAFKVKAL